MDLVNNPVDRLREALGHAPEGLRKAIVWHGCMMLDRPQQRTKRPYDSRVPMGQLYKAYTVDDFCEELTSLIDDRQLDEHFATVGLIHSIAMRMERNADPHVEQLRQAQSQGDIQRLNHYLALPLDDRPVLIPDNDLRTMIKQAEEGLARSEQFKEESLDLAAQLKAFCDEVFPPVYWVLWEQQSLRNSSRER
ncbi:MAG: hypothetical protein Q8K78_10265, partial [Planctomycetaceae bacterium]|nr:hypothetical protein [Planctomycetaceae bacterium]